MLLHDGCPNGEQFLCVSGPEEEIREGKEGEEDEENGPKVTIAWTPPPTLPSDQDMLTVHSQGATRSLGDSILDAMEQLRGEPGSTPFSTGCTKHATGVVSTGPLQPIPRSGPLNAAFQHAALTDSFCMPTTQQRLSPLCGVDSMPWTPLFIDCALQGGNSSGGADSEALFGEKALPGNAQELKDFTREAIRKSACRVTCTLPYLLLSFPRKDVFDTIYLRYEPATAKR